MEFVPIESIFEDLIKYFAAVTTKNSEKKFN